MRDELKDIKERIEEVEAKIKLTDDSGERLALTLALKKLKERRDTIEGQRLFDKFIR